LKDNDGCDSDGVCLPLGDAPPFDPDAGKNPAAVETR
jgi:hypothetical protein